MLSDAISRIAAYALKKRILQSTATIREQTQTISSLYVKSPLEMLYRTFDNFFGVVGDRSAVHARTVSTLATDAARKLGLDSEVIAAIRLAGLLHDIGKFGSMVHDLHKQLDDMTASEAGEYRQHPLFCNIYRLLLTMICRSRSNRTEPQTVIASLCSLWLLMYSVERVSMV